MNNCMPRFAGNEPAGGRRPFLAEETFAPSSPGAWRALAAVSDARRKRAAQKLARAEREVHRACDEARRAEADLARLRNHADELEREWHRAHRYREAQGRDLQRARAAQAQREVLLAKHAEDVRSVARGADEARQILYQTQQDYRASARKDEKRRVLRARLDVGGHHESR
ncbi:hypothetical protein [Trinickia dinghuensis]|uniref:hypothetical protein n=1 Tax=Trinickia dinghuensis TaxID=2291023 RepID=UPI0015F1A2B4|nr:hypothetical protein [Trinickia dinghuensis]